MLFGWPALLRTCSCHRLEVDWALHPLCTEDSFHRRRNPWKWEWRKYSLSLNVDADQTKNWHSSRNPTCEFGQVSGHFHIEKHGLFRIFFKKIRFTFSSTMNNGMWLDQSRSYSRISHSSRSFYLHITDDLIGFFKISQITTDQMTLIRSIERQT